MGPPRRPVAGLAALAAVAATVAAGWLWWGEPSSPVGPETGLETASGPAHPGPPAAAADTVVVHVSGAVLSPGLVTVPAGARVADVIAAAGGAGAGADLPGLNLAATVSDGDHVLVPAVGAAPAAGTRNPDDPGSPAGSSAEGALSLNQAAAAELEALPGIGPVIAARIVAHREANGPFQAVEDLLDVAGIGEAKLAAIRDLVVVP